MKVNHIQEYIYLLVGLHHMKNHLRLVLKDRYTQYVLRVLMMHTSPGYYHMVGYVLSKMTKTEYGRYLRIVTLK